MKILWVKTDYLHPTTRGGQIRTLEMIKRLHHRHEVHYATLDDGKNAEGPLRAHEYSSKHYSVAHIAPPHTSLRFAGQVAAGAFSPLPVAISRYRSEKMRQLVTNLIRTERFDSIVCDFLVSAANVEDLSQCVLFQHNVETMIWRRHAENAPDPLRKAYFSLQAKRMFEFERRACRDSLGVVAVSDADAQMMQSMFDADRVSAVPTGVDIAYFCPPETASRVADLVFVGSMDWMPNSDGILYFVREILPLIRAKRPGCTLAIVGRDPGADVRALAASDPGISVTGTVPDVRPYLWGAPVSIVPLRVGGGTRLKIYEAMAARTAVVSTTVGAEGLAVESPEHIRLADSSPEFAQACIELLDNAGERRRMVDSAWELVSSRFSWDHVVRCFERAIGLTVSV